jgi:DNA-binding SARP family transcriptional activator/tetratricopeptide (TPR) repeat protein
VTVSACEVFFVAANRLEIRLLGRVEVLRGGPVELPPSKKARALLAYLVATERAHDRNYVASLLWEERDDTRAALRWALSRLRPVLDDQTTRLVTDRDRVGFERKDADVDLASVRHALREGIDRVSTETLEGAAARFRGDLLEGLDLTECYGFHAWCVAEREAARALRTSILSTLVSRLADDPERALGYARTRLDLDPLSGTAQASVVRILGALGRQREAEQLYQSFKQMVQSRLGERTSVELERARAAARTAPPMKPAPSTMTVELPPVAAATTTTAPIDRLARSPFVGRERELATLTATLDSAVQGGGGFVEIAGQAGVGKSRLVEELIHQARLRGARVMVGRCLEGDGSPAFLPFLDSLDAVLADETTLERLVGTDASLAARISPRVAARLREPPPPAAVDATSERYLVFQAVSTLLERIAAPAGALLVVEDLHWIDQPSLALLRYLVARLDGTRLLVVTTYRDEDLDAKARHALVDLRRHGGSRIALSGLSKPEVHALVDALGGSAVAATLRDRLADVTAGHPLFLQEMLKHLVEENALDDASAASVTVPEGVRQVIERRLGRLSERGKRILVVASPMIGAFEWECVRALCDDNEDDLLDALEEVMGAQLLRERVASGHASYEFSHALVAQTIYESLPNPRRARLNRQIGEALERLHASNVEPHLAALAHHFHLAGVDGASRAKAADYAVRAGDRAAALLACEEAVRHWERALEIVRADPELRLPVPTWEIHRRRGRALAVVSAWNEACAAYEQALADAPADAREWRAEVLVDYGVASLWAMNMPGVYARAQHADELARTLGRPDLTVAIGGLLAQCLASNGDIDAAIAKYGEVRTLREGRHVSSLSLAPLTLYWNGRIPDALVWAAENLDAARAAQDVVSLLVGLPPFGMALAASGRYEEAAAAFAEARTIGERHRAGSLLARAVSMSTGYHLDRGDVDTAEDLASEARELSLSSGWTPGEVSAGIDLAVCRLRRGDVTAAERHIEESTRTAEGIRNRNPGTSGFHDWLWAIRIAWVRTEVALARAAHDEVERLAVEALRVSEGGRPKYEVATLVTRAASRAKRDRTKDALADLDRALSRAANDPALRLRAAIPRQAIEPAETLAAEIAELSKLVRSS